MVKPKKKRQVTAVAENNLNYDLCENEDDWVIIKKQKVTILVPPLPEAHKSVMPDSEPSQLQAVPRKIINNKSQNSTETQPEKLLVDEQEKPTSLAPKRGIDITALAPHHLPKLSLQDSRTESKNQDHIHASNLHHVLGLSHTSKTIKKSQFPHSFGGSLDQSIFLNQRLRVFNLERKLAKAGGLSRWLTSLGLGQFIRLFKRKGISKFQLVNLTMKKLKDMGANAVGPRRKLMHAIEGVCQPNCCAAF